MYLTIVFVLTTMSRLERSPIDTPTKERLPSIETSGCDAVRVKIRIGPVISLVTADTKGKNKVSASHRLPVGIVPIKTRRKTPRRAFERVIVDSAVSRVSSSWPRCDKSSDSRPIAGRRAYAIDLY